MFEALIVFSRKGTFKETISSREITSKEHARKLFPLVTPSLPHQLVTWISPSLNNGKLVKRGHFRTLSGSHKFNPKQLFELDEAKRVRLYGESPEHKRAKDLIIFELNRRLQANLALPWRFSDNRASDFHLTGNLLLGANQIEPEQILTTPFGSTYKLDIAVLGQVINRTPIILGGIEIERTHTFDGRKALIGKSQGFPLISIDVSEMSLDEITPEWAMNILTATTRTQDDGLRKTFVYLHDILYPLYIQLPEFIDREHRHQFLVFASNDDLGKLQKWLKNIQRKLSLPEKALLLSVVNAKSEQSRKVLENAGDITGYNWQSINNQLCLRIVVNRPTSPTDTSLHLFHICLARLLLSHTNSLVGYKYANGIGDGDHNEDIWVHHKWEKDKQKSDKYRVLPKLLAEPANIIFETLNLIGKNAIT